MYYLRPFIVPIILSIFLSNSLTAQNWDEILNLSDESYALVEVLNSIKNAGVPLAFSSDRLPQIDIEVYEYDSPKSILKRLQDDKVVNIVDAGSQILISKYEPTKYTLNGVIKNEESDEFLIGATIKISDHMGTITNTYGYYAITAPEGKYKVSISHIGFENYEKEIRLEDNIYQSFHLKPQTITLDEIEIKSSPSDINISGNIPSVNSIQIDQKFGQIPYLLGEVDIVKSAQLRPGISTIGEDANGFHVRGGRVDQNLILLDEAIIYNPSHYILASVFNPEAINDIKIYKGFIPPSYGGRTSSVMEVIQKEGNTKRTKYAGGIGPFSIRGVIDGPIKKNKSSFLVSGRQSLLNLSIDDFNSTSIRRNRNSFQDLNIKINSKPNKHNTYYLSAYYGNDRNTAGLNSIQNWGNRMINFRWNHIYSPRLFSNLSSFISEYSYQVESPEEPGAFVSTSRIVNYSIKSDFAYAINPDNEVSFGISTIFHNLKPGERQPFYTNSASTNTIVLDVEHGLESGIYLSHEMNLLEKIKLNYGLRYSSLHVFGPEEVYYYQEGTSPSDTTLTDTVSFDKNEVIKSYFNAEPRFALSYQFDRNTSVKLSYTRTAQYLHLISNTLAPSPTDIWKLTDTNIPPTFSTQYTLGIYKNFNNNQFESSVEVYYKDNFNNITYRDGADLVFNEDIEREILAIDGRAYGIELYLAKKHGTLTGWLSYTLSRTESKLQNLEQDDFTLNNFDRPHDLSITTVYDLNRRISISGTFVYQTGIPFTFPSDKYLYEDNLVPLFTDINSSRLPDYHRLDLSFRLEGKYFKKDGSIRKNRDAWVFTLYNAYARRNVNSYFFRESENNDGLGEIVQYSIFGTIIPSITYNFKF